MADLLIPFLFLVLLFVIVLQAVERHVYGEQMQREISKLVTAFLSKDATEFAQAVKIEKEPQRPQIESDEVELTNATDEEFDKFIKQQNQ